MHIIEALETEWDQRKAEANWRKHRVRFADAVAVLEDEFALTIRDPAPGEERWVTLGVDGFGRLLVVVYTWRGEALRLISARRATAAERRQYEESG
ncbi:MAG: BrnT family toxin [Terriglobales bacterium]